MSVIVPLPIEKETTCLSTFFFVKFDWPLSTIIHRNLPKDSNMSYTAKTQYKKQLPTYHKKVVQRNSERVTHLMKVLDTKKQITSLLDFGCGNAEITSEIARDYGIKTVYGVDVYPESESKHKSIIYKQVKDNKIDIPDHSIDLVTCYMSIHHFEDFDKMMAEICRVLKPGGWLFFREHDVGKDNVDLRTFLDDMHKQYPDHPGGTINYWDRAQLKAKLQESLKFKHVKDSDYPKHIKNKQAIYHSLYLYSA